MPLPESQLLSARQRIWPGWVCCRIAAATPPEQRITPAAARAQVVVSVAVPADTRPGLIAVNVTERGLCVRRNGTALLDRALAGYVRAEEVLCV
jgi:hypothetical protein